MPTKKMPSPPTEAVIWEILQTIMDPEIPVISLVELGVIRRVGVRGEQITVALTPTFSGCPAIHKMKDDIRSALRNLAPEFDLKIETVLSPPWTTDWIDEAALAKLKAFGLSPPPRHGGNINVTFFDSVACPYCDSEKTTLKNNWGTTPCRTMFYCDSCQQPFEQFKPL